MFYVVAFDIVDDRVRYRAVKVLKSYGMRVQKSVFECSGLTEEQFLKMKERLEACIDAAQDSVLYYHLCRRCLPKTEISGLGEPPRPESFRVS